MSRKSKINPIEKVKTVERYLNGAIGIRQAGRKLGVAYQSIQKWISIYKSKGPVGLLKPMPIYCAILIEGINT